MLLFHPCSVWLDNVSLALPWLIPGCLQCPTAAIPLAWLDCLGLPKGLLWLSQPLLCGCRQKRRHQQGHQIRPPSPFQDFSRKARGNPGYGLYRYTIPLCLAHDSTLSVGLRIAICHRCLGWRPRWLRFPVHPLLSRILVF